MAARMRLNANATKYSELRSSSETKGLKITDGYLKNVHPTVFSSTVVQYYFFARNA